MEAYGKRFVHPRYGVSNSDIVVSNINITIETPISEYILSISQFYNSNIEVLYSDIGVYYSVVSPISEFKTLILELKTDIKILGNSIFEAKREFIKNSIFDLNN